MSTYEMIFTALYGPVLFWLSVMMFKLVQKVATIDTGVKAMHEDITYLKSNDEKLDSKMNLFLKGEIDTLKEIARSVRKEPD